MNRFYDIVVLIGSAVILFTFILSLKHRKTDQPYMKWLFMAIIVGLLVTINTFLGVYLIWYSAQI
ncbi:MAG: hypothetical protein WBO30_01885, partial [Ferruginibacter sp.]